MPEASSLPSDTHKAIEGLHDIKPLPAFSPFPYNFVWGAFGLLASLLLFLLIRKIRKRGNNLASTAPFVSPLDAGLAGLHRLSALRQKGSISLRDLCSQLSLLLRSYLEQRLEFPAVEQTAAEVTQSLPLALSRALPVLAKDRHLATTSRVKAVLRNLERLTFGDTATEYFHLGSNEITSLFSEIETLLRELDAALLREEDRTRSVVDVEKAIPC